MSDFETPEQRKQDDADALKFWAKLRGEPEPDPFKRLDTAERALADANAAAERACIRPGETLAELIARLYSETLDAADD